MEMTSRQKELFELGCKIRETFNIDNVRAAIREAMMNDFCVDEIEDAIESKYRLFFKAGIIGRVPEWREGYRFGEIPACGNSTNWATGEQEEGVSCVCLNENKCEETVYDSIYGLQGIEKIKIAGWYIGGSGTDGEPLLVCPVKM
jgi:hypothetical protein